MFTTRTTAVGLGSRLDPNHYSPEAVALDQALWKLGSQPIHTIVNPNRKITNGVRGPALQPSKFKLVRLQDCRDWEVMFQDCLTISEAQFVENRRCRLQRDDVIVAIGGYLGNAAIVSEHGEAVIGQHSALLPFGHSTGNDPRYVVAYLNSSYGAIQFSRWSRGTVQAGLNLEDIADIAIPLADPVAQAYIGNKVRQAEGLRAVARTLTTSAERYFAGLHSRSIDGWRGSWRRRAHVLAEGRLDAWFYATAPTKLERGLSASGASPVGKRVKAVRKNSFDANRSIQYFEIGNVDTATGCVWPREVAPDLIPSRAKRSVRTWDILVSTVRPERKNIALVGPGCEGQLVASSGFSVLRATSPQEAAFICWFLRSDAATDQLLRWNTGATYPAIEDDVPLNVLMPKYRDTEVEYHGTQWMKIPNLLSTASNLTAAARFLVEALIEQKVTETDLIAAHKSPDADRALLARLTQKGLDIPDADPLFPDLDRLEELLIEAQAEGGE